MYFSYLPLLLFFQINRLNEVLCTSEGRFPYEEPCSSKYFKCIRNERGALEGYLLDCPSKYAYSPVSGNCVPSETYPYCANYYQINDNIES